VLNFVLLALGGEGVNVPFGEDAHAMDSVGAPSGDDNMLLNCFEHVSRPKV
jgi:hypothetical protein